MTHKFHIGQLVRRRDPAAGRNGNRIFEIVGLLPTGAGERGYRIRSSEAGTHEVREADLTAASCCPAPTS
ncbi:hypothetical protein [uncultured Methylobacterium sp.]|uniref:hypothetical protein n=1 Tax=uncultured Methylobacterium sp. TaxID=157278 RepID=UPI0035C968FD